MIQVRINAETCLCYGNCALVAPAVFAIDDDRGIAVTLRSRLADEHVADVQRAAYDCPTRSITYVQEPLEPH